MDANLSKPRSLLLTHPPVPDRKSPYLPNVPHVLGLNPCKHLEMEFLDFAVEHKKPWSGSGVLVPTLPLFLKLENVLESL